MKEGGALDRAAVPGHVKWGRASRERARAAMDGRTGSAGAGP